MNYPPLIAGLVAAAALVAVAYLAHAPIARHWRSVLPRLPLPALAIAASYGVYSFSALFVPTWVAIVQAAAFELTYIGLSVTTSFAPAQRRRAVLVSIAAVVVSVIYNTLAGWFHRQPQLLLTDDPVAWLMLAILHGAPLAWVAYYVAQLLLHAESAQPSRIPAQRRALVRRLVAALRETRAELAQVAHELAQARAAVAQQADALAQAGDVAARAHTEAAQVAAPLRAELDAARAALAQRERDLAQARAEVARLADEAAQGGEVDVRGLARWCASLGASQREIARKLNKSESTVRGWVGKASAPVSAAD